ncbi:MAG: RDD family protein, partial [Treponema sp.]|nr:RDD family protein [Treponema sp.]
MAAAGAGYSPVDSILGVQTPEGVEFALFPAGPPVRACAYVIDKAIQWVFNIGLLIITEFLGEAAGIWIVLLLLFCVDWFYHVICEVFFRGQTPGKKIMGIRVVGSDGSPVSGGA